MLLNFSYYVIISSLIGSNWALDLPSYFPKCCVKDPRLNECLFNAANIVRPHIANGIKKIKLPSLNPYIIPAFSGIQKMPNANYTGNVKNFTFHGLQNYNIISLRYDPILLKLSGHVTFPQIGIHSLHEVNGTVFQVPVTSVESFSWVTGPVKAIFEVDGELVTRGNEIYYFNPVVVKIPLIIDSVKGGIRRLDTEELENLTNKFLSENPRELAKLSTPVIQELFENLVFRYVKFVTGEIPYDRIFPCLL